MNSVTHTSVEMCGEDILRPGDLFIGDPMW
jgi:hypothetical protein